MLLYQYPPRRSSDEMAALAGERLKEKKKTKSLLIKTAVLFLITVLLCVRAPFIWLKVLIFVILFWFCVINLFVVRSLNRKSDSGAYTRIYDDRLEHRQPNFIRLGKDKYKEVSFKYEDIKSSRQNAWGNLEIVFKDGKILSLYFCDTNAKLFLIENLHDKIKYPMKNYLPYDDEEEQEDKSWYD